jgi:hypothetical protein
MAASKTKVIVDTSVYISFINQGTAYPTLDVEEGAPLFYLSAVVLAELYAGAWNNSSIKLLDDLYDLYEKKGRLVVPAARDWQKTGKVAAQLGRKYGFEEKYVVGITHDILIALSARQVGAAVVTHNVKDFLRIKEWVDFKVYGGGG